MIISYKLVQLLLQAMHLFFIHLHAWESFRVSSDNRARVYTAVFKNTTFKFCSHYFSDVCFVTFFEALDAYISDPSSIHDATSFIMANWWNDWSCNHVVSQDWFKKKREKMLISLLNFGERRLRIWESFGKQGSRMRNCWMWVGLGLIYKKKFHNNLNKLIICP